MQKEKEKKKTRGKEKMERGEEEKERERGKVKNEEGDERRSGQGRKKREEGEADVHNVKWVNVNVHGPIKALKVR